MLNYERGQFRVLSLFLVTLIKNIQIYGLFIYSYNRNRRMEQVHSNFPSSLSSPSFQTSQQAMFDEVSTAYRVNRNNTANKVTREKVIIIFKFHLILIFVAILLYVMSFPIKYIIANTDSNRIVENCQKNDIKFNGWSFRSVCTKCGPNYELSNSLLCKTVGSNNDQAFTQH